MRTEDSNTAAGTQLGRVAGPGQPPRDGGTSPVPADVITVTDLRKSYGRVQAVRGISFTVRQGEILALLGPNGAGKTTTLEILEGFRTRDAGTARVLGLDPGDRADARGLRERTGLVLQDIAVEPYLTVAETIARDAGYYAAPREVGEVIAMVGLEGQERRKVRNLSGGQKRRLDLALGLIGDPELLFLDEPTTGFDPSARRDAWQLVRDLRRSGTTILLTTHDMAEAQALADRVVVLTAGRVAAEGTPSSIGGRETAVARITFTLPSDTAPPDTAPPDTAPSGTAHADLPVPAAPDGKGGFVVETATPTAALQKLTTWALERGLELGRLAVERPSLEDVYLELTSDEALSAAPEGSRR